MVAGLVARVKRERRNDMVAVFKPELSCESDRELEFEM